MTGYWRGILASALLLAACGESDPIDVVETSGPDLCGANVYPVGIPIDTAGVEDDRSVRIVKPGRGSPRTTSSRLTLEVDDEGTLVRAYCG